MTSHRSDFWLGARSQDWVITITSCCPTVNSNSAVALSTGHDRSSGGRNTGQPSRMSPCNNSELWTNSYQSERALLVLLGSAMGLNRARDRRRCEALRDRGSASAPGRGADTSEEVGVVCQRPDRCPPPARALVCHCG